MQAFSEHDYAKKIDLRLWKRLIRYAKPYTPHLIGIMVAMLVCAWTDVLFPLLTREAIDVFIVKGTTEGMGWFLARYAANMVVQTGCVATFCFLSGRVEVGMCRLIRTKGFQRLQELPFSYYDRTPIGYIIARMTNDTQRLSDTIGWGLIDLFWGGGFIVMTIGVMMSINLRLSVAVLVVIPLIGLITVFFQKRILKSYRVARKTNSEITGAFNEGIMGAKTTKTLVREDRNHEEFAVLTERMKGASIRAAVLSALFLPLVVSLGAIAAAWVLWQGGIDVFHGAISFGTLTAFVGYSLQIFDPFTNLARIFAELQSSQSAAERVIALLETQPEIADTEAVRAEFGDNFHPQKENWPAVEGRIEFEDVSFSYQGGEDVLTHFSLTVEAGQTIALVGETGSGKSTIVNLLCRFYEPSEGRILIDGVDTRARSQLWLESNLGYVLQEPHLFSGTIADNIRYGKLDASDDEVRAAARRVYAEPFILALEKGYQTPVGEGGNRLSTGQKQLISFARAIINDPRLFVLDEATSSVDTETEQKIQKAIASVLEHRTSFIIAHRLSTIRTADRILVIQDGVVTEQGTHRELLAQRGYYHKLYTTQFQEERARAELTVEAGKTADGAAAQI